MKKSIFTILFISVFYLISIAQHQIGGNISYGIPYYKIVNTNSNATINYTPEQLYDIELNYKKRWPGVLNFGSSISYQFQSSHFEKEVITPNSYVFQERNYQLNYINIKVFPEFVYGENIKISLQLGPSISFLVYSDINGYTDVSNSINGVKIRTEESGTASDDFDIVNFLLFAGAGIDIPINDNILINGGIQYQYNINSWFAVEENTYSDRSLIFRLGIAYKLKQIL